MRYIIKVGYVFYILHGVSRRKYSIGDKYQNNNFFNTDALINTHKCVHQVLICMTKYLGKKFRFSYNINQKVQL